MIFRGFRCAEGGAKYFGVKHPRKWWGSNTPGGRNVAYFQIWNGPCPYMIYMVNIELHYKRAVVWLKINYYAFIVWRITLLKYNGLEIV